MKGKCGRRRGRKAKGHGPIFLEDGEGLQGVTWERREEEIEDWLVLMLDHKGEEDGWALTHGES